uniref:Uncharacterized protein n=1 Tax=Oryza glumipatula TaxID=40148 RepID=A0A0D9Z4A1_9ORYZ
MDNTRLFFLLRRFQILDGLAHPSAAMDLSAEAAAAVRPRVRRVRSGADPTATTSFNIARESKRGATAQQPRNDLSNVGNCWCSSILMVIVGPTFRYAGLSCCSFEVWGANLVWTNCQMYHYKFLR